MAADELLLRQAPHSPQAEQAVLGSMLIDPDCIKDVMDKLQPEDFYLRANRDIFETIYHMFVYSRPIDGVTVAGEMEKNGVYNDNTRDYLLQLMDVTPTSANVMEYVQIVLDKSLMRQVASAAGSITAMVQEGTGTAGGHAGVGGAEGVRHPPGTQRPEHGDGGHGAAGRDGPSGGADRQRRQDAAGPVHGPFRRGRQDQRTE